MNDIKTVIGAFRGADVPHFRSFEPALVPATKLGYSRKRKERNLLVGVLCCLTCGDLALMLPSLELPSLRHLYLSYIS